MKNKMGVLFILLSQLFVFVPTSKASYLRFWRGYPKSDITLAQFNSDLNDIFLPATAALAKTPAHLVSYQPLLMPEYLIQSNQLPVELALVEYASEGEYRSYRETREGQDYSNLHWDYFEKDTSKSTVPTPFAGILESDKAYLIGNNIDWKNGPTLFSYLPNDNFVIQTLLQDLPTLQKVGFKGVVLIAPTYVMIYAKSFLTPALSRFLLWQTTLRTGTILKYGSGVQYPL